MSKKHIVQQLGEALGEVLGAKGKSTKKEAEEGNKRSTYYINKEHMEILSKILYMEEPRMSISEWIREVVEGYLEDYKKNNPQKYEVIIGG